MAERIVKTVRFNSSISKRKFQDVLVKHGYKFNSMGDLLDTALVGYAIWLEGEYVASYSKDAALIRLHDVAQFEILPTKEAFDAYLLAWVPSEPDVEISNNP
ncbi:hypothetical protein nACB1_076 [Acinetobacter phage nACB1]|nr:hypothetical protein nACB1_076 [Acinetobacter phage nACB1]